MIDRFNMIDSFNGPYAFLSNFYPVDVEFEGLVYKNSEAAYQAAKTLDLEIRKTFTTMKANQSKKAGRALKLREDWEDVKLSVMKTIVRSKFDKNDELKHKLLCTGVVILVEGNWWGDTFWGVCKGSGLNHLGKILMDLRFEFQLRADLDDIKIVEYGVF
jgi:ribA/ribD-fused uncharacterized protein